MVALSFGEMIAFSCPLNQERIGIERAISGELIAGDSKSNVIDYLSFLPVSSNPNSCFVVASVQDDGDCHACGTTLSIYELKKKGNTWGRIFEQRAALTMGGFGRAPKPKLINLNGPAFRFDLGGMHFGHIQNNLVLVARLNGNFKEILSLPIHYDNSGSGEDEEFEWNAAVKFLKGRDNFPEIQAIYSGTEKMNDKIVMVDRTEIYRFTGQRYESVEPPNKSLKPANLAQDDR
jgi:hypothetical protein